MPSPSNPPRNLPWPRHVRPPRADGCSRNFALADRAQIEMGVPTLLVPGGIARAETFDVGNVKIFPIVDDATRIPRGGNETCHLAFPARRLRERDHGHGVVATVRDEQL